MDKLTTKKEINLLALLFAFTYMVSYITRINYGAIIVEMVSATGFSSSALSMAVTGSFITYGAGQIISGIVGDKISPKKLVLYGLFLTGCMNVLLPFCANPFLMLGIWCVNGFAQSFMWPPIVRLMTTLLSTEDYKKTMAKVSWGSSIGTIIVYLLSPVLISCLGWKWVFWFSAIVGFITIFIWNRYCYEIGVQKREKTTIQKSNEKKYKIFTPLMLGIMLAIILQGMLRDGVTTWMPSYIKDTYHLDNEISILTGVVLPIFSILCFQAATKLYVKRFTNPLTCATVFFGVGTLSAVGIYFSTGSSAVCSVALSALLTGCMHGVNLMLICMIPSFFEKSGKVSTVSGVINSCTYIGSAISTYGIAFLSEKLGWGFTLLSWIAIAGMGAVLCIICIKSFKTRFLSGF